MKASANAVARRQIEREAAILECLAAPFMPCVYGWGAVGGWTVLVLEDLSAAQWPPPFPDGGDALLETVPCQRRSHRLKASKAGRRRPYGTYWQRIAADPQRRSSQTGAVLAAWLDAALPSLEAAESEPCSRVTT